MIAVYSTRFFALHGANGTFVYIVPAGRTAVVRDVDFYNGGGLSPAYYFLQGSAGQAIDYFQSPDLVAHTHQWRGRQVYNAGESITVQSSQPSDITVSGYLLVNP